MNLTEYYYEKNKIPERYYNQLNKKTAQQNYRKSKKNKDGFLFSLIKDTLRITLNKALKELLKEFESRSQ